MYHSGLPFNNYTEIENINLNERYFQLSDIYLPFCKSVYEGFLQNKVDLVIYQETDWDNYELFEYHRKKYQNTPYHTENKIGDNVYKIISVLEGKITGIQIFKYDKLWRVEIEQCFDENHLLLEYRKMNYSNELKRTPNKEKTFFSSWHISEEVYE